MVQNFIDTKNGGYNLESISIIGATSLSLLFLRCSTLQSFIANDPYKNLIDHPFQRPSFSKNNYMVIQIRFKKLPAKQCSPSHRVTMIRTARPAHIFILLT